jgi:hypothetical protein
MGWGCLVGWVRLRVLQRLSLSFRSFDGKISPLDSSRTFRPLASAFHQGHRRSSPIAHRDRQLCSPILLLETIRVLIEDIEGQSGFRTFPSSAAISISASALHQNTFGNGFLEALRLTLTPQFQCRIEHLEILSNRGGVLLNQRCGLGAREILIMRKLRARLIAFQNEPVVAVKQALIGKTTFPVHRKRVHRNHLHWLR